MEKPHLEEDKNIHNREMAQSPLNTGPSAELHWRLMAVV